MVRLTKKLYWLLGTVFQKTIGSGNGLVLNRQQVISSTNYNFGLQCCILSSVTIPQSVELGHNYDNINSQQIVMLIGVFKCNNCLLQIKAIIHSFRPGVFLLSVIMVRCFDNNLNPFSSKQNGWHVADNIFKCILLNENVWISMRILLKFVSMSVYLTINQHWFR